MTLEDLKTAVRTAAALRLVQTLQPIGGTGDKVFPPTYAGGIYATETRRIDGEAVPCVLLNSVQSEANGLEEALQDAFLLDWREIRENGGAPRCDLPVIAVKVKGHEWVTSLTAPHRIHDAILRDSIDENETPFRDTGVGQAIVKARVHDATAFYKHCPTALLFGTWDSTAGEGLNSAKIPRAVVSEIIGVNVVAGVRTASRVDPLRIQRMGLTFYQKGKSGWTFDESEADRKYKKAGSKQGKTEWTLDIDQAEKDQNRKPTKSEALVAGAKPSDINHGNVPPDIDRFKDVQKNKLDVLPDILTSNPVRLKYDVETGDGHLESRLDINSQTARIREKVPRPGGVTMDHARHTWTLSLTQLRRLRFPGFPPPEGQKKGDVRPRQDEAARTVLAALALYALALRQDEGYWLRSRCDLVPDNGSGAKLEIVGGTGGDIPLGTANEVRTTLLDPALKEAEGLGVEWTKTLLRLTPSPQLSQLVALSDALGPSEDESDSDAPGGADNGADDDAGASD